MTDRPGGTAALLAENRALAKDLNLARMALRNIMNCLKLANAIGIAAHALTAIDYKPEEKTND